MAAGEGWCPKATVLSSSKFPLISRELKEGRNRAQPLTRGGFGGRLEPRGEWVWRVLPAVHLDRELYALAATQTTRAMMRTTPELVGV